MKLKAQNLKKLVARVMTLVMLVALLPNVFLQNNDTPVVTTAKITNFLLS